jgi:putative ABC transport system permease protein
MTGLNRMLARALWHNKAQVLAIALVVASGMALLIMALTTIEALEETADAYYQRYRFADVFAHVKRAPEPLKRDIAAIPGVQTVQTRIVESATLDVAGYAKPVTGRLISLPERGPLLLNALVLRSGRLPASDRPNEVVLSEPFAEAHGLKQGDTLDAILRGRKRTLRVVGTALSPEFVYAIAPGGLMPNDETFGVLWMGRKALEAAYDFKESFNDVTLGLIRGTRPQTVIDRVDALLDRYGSTGAYARAEQVSNWFLQNEIEQNRNMAHLLPTIFLAVAAFLVNMVMARLIAAERRQIGLLKAFGYRNWEIGWHYAKMGLAIGTLGVALGACAGALLGHWNTEMYAEFYRFPFLLYRPGPSSFAIAATVSLAAMLAGSLFALRRAVVLPPAEAMQPPSPPTYHRGWLTQTALGRLLDEPTRMVARRLLRWPGRTLFAAAGLAMSVAVLILALQWLDAIDTLVESQFVHGQHQDATISFEDLRPMRVARDIERLPGVTTAEPYRSVAVRFRHGHRHERESITGVAAGATLAPVFDSERGAIDMPPGGLVLSRTLARLLAVETGDSVTVEVLEGRRPTLQLPVVRVFDTYVGKPAYMSLAALNRLMRDGRVAGGTHVAVDPDRRAVFLAKLKQVPNVTAVTFRQVAIDNFYDTRWPSASAISRRCASSALRAGKPPTSCLANSASSPGSPCHSDASQATGSPGTLPPDSRPSCSVCRWRSAMRPTVMRR